MPRNIRPSFVKLKVDGLKSPIATGPRKRSGEMSAEFLVRHKGSVLSLLDVDMIASEDGKTVLVRVVLNDAEEDITLYERRFEQ